MATYGPDLRGFDKHVEPERLQDWREFVVTLYGWTTILSCSVLAVVGEYLAPIGALEIESTLEASTRYPPLVAGLVGLCIVFLALGILAVGHEGLHWVSLRCFGYDAEVEFRELRTVSTEEMVERNHQIFSLLTPLLVLSPFAYVAAVLSPFWELSMLFSLVLILNLGGSGLDLKNTLRAIADPSGTKYWAEYADDELVGVRYTPTESG